MRTSPIALTLIFSLAIMAALPQSASANDEPLSTALGVDLERFRFDDSPQPMLRVRYSQETTRSIGDPRVDGMTAITTIDGYLHRRVLDEIDGGIVVVMALSQVRVSVDDPNITLHPAFLQAPFLVDYDLGGGILDIRFAPLVPTRVRDALSALVGALEVPLPAEPANAWQAVKHQARHRRNVSYRLLNLSEDGSRVVLGRKLQSEERINNARRFSYRVQASEGRLELTADGKGIQSLSTQDVIGVYYRGQKTSDRVISVEAVVDQGTYPIALPSSTSEIDEVIYGDRAQRLQFYEQSPDEIRAVKSLTFDDAMATFMENVDDHTPRASFILRQFVRLYPEHAASVPPVLNDLPQTEKNRERIGHAYAALAATGHLEAQRAIAWVLTDDRFNAINKDRAARATLSMRQPESFVPAAVWGYRQSLAATNTKELQQKGLITNVYGALGGWEHGNRAITQEVFDTLMTEYRAAGSLEKGSDVLPALGNIGDLELLWPVFEPLFAHASPVVRRRAYFVFLKSPHKLAFERFAERFDHEPEASVRLAASLILESMPPSLPRLRWAMDRVIDQRDSVVQGRMVRIIGDEMRSDPRTAAVLRELVGTDITRDVKEMAYRYIKPQGGAL